MLQKGKEFLHWKYFFNFIQQCTEVGTSVNQPIVYSSTKYDTSDFEKNCSVVSCLWWFFTVNILSIFSKDLTTKKNMSTFKTGMSNNYTLCCFHRIFKTADYFLIWYIQCLVQSGLWLWCLMPLSTTFQIYRGGNQSTRRKSPTCQKSLTNFIT